MASFSRRLLLLLILVAVFSNLSVGTMGKKKKECFIDRIVNLGDSLSDTGNWAQEVWPSATVFQSLPYGQSIPEGPTGRCSDGLLIIDYLAKGLGLPRSAAYLDQLAKFDHGVNFAVTGATALSSESLEDLGVHLPGTHSSLDVQLTWFKDYFSTVCLSHQDCADRFEKTLFLVGEIGGNDYNYALVQNKPINQVKLLVPMVVNKILNTAKSLISYGARHLVIPGNFPIGCLPRFLTLFGNTTNKDDFGCISELNEFTKFYNEYLEFSINDLSRENPNVSIAYADYYNPLLKMIRSPSAYGFEEGSELQACCGKGGAYNFNMVQRCGMGVPVCSDPSKFISWDGLHLTQAAYRVIGNHLFSNVELLKKWKCRDTSLLVLAY